MADVDTVWKAGADGDFEEPLNWTNGVPGTTAAELVAVYDGTSQTSCIKNVNQIGSTHVFKIRRTPQYLGNIGAPGEPLAMDGVSLDLSATIRGGASGKTYLKLDFGGTSDAIIDGNGGHETILDGEYLGLMLKGGARVTCISTCELVGTVTVDGFGSQLTIQERDSTEGLPPTMLVYNGTVLCARTDSLDLFVGGGGTVQWTGVLQSTSVVNVQGSMEYNPLGDPSGQTPNLYVGPTGRLDLTGYPGSIPSGRVIVQDGGLLTGTVIDAAPNFPDYDLNLDWP